MRKIHAPERVPDQVLGTSYLFVGRDWDEDGGMPAKPTGHPLRPNQNRAAPLQVGTNLVLQKGGMKSRPCCPNRARSSARESSFVGSPIPWTTQSRENHRRRSQKATQDVHFPWSTETARTSDVKSSMETGSRPVLAWVMGESVISLPAHASSRTPAPRNEMTVDFVNPFHVVTEPHTALVSSRVEFTIVWSMHIPSAHRKTADLVLMVAQPTACRCRPTKPHRLSAGVMTSCGISVPWYSSPVIPRRGGPQVHDKAEYPPGPR